VTFVRRIIELNRANPGWTDKYLAAAAGCDASYVRTVCQRHGLVRGNSRPSTVFVRGIEPELADWLEREARRMGRGVSRSAVVLAVLRDAMAEPA